MKLLNMRWIKDRIEAAHRMRGNLIAEKMDINRLGLGLSIDETDFFHPEELPTTDEDVLKYLAELEELAKEASNLFNFVVEQRGFIGKIEVKTDDDWNTQKIAIKLKD